MMLLNEKATETTFFKKSATGPEIILNFIGRTENKVYVSAYIRQKRVGQSGVFASARNALHRPNGRVYEYDHRLLQYAQIPRADGRSDRRQRPDVCPALVARRNRRAARPVVQLGPAPVQGDLRTARSQVYHRLRVYADPHHHLPRGRRHPPQGDAVDPQTHAIDDPATRWWMRIRRPNCACARSSRSATNTR